MSDLQALFSRDPLSYTKDGKELETIITEMRANRKKFLLGNIKAGSTKPVSEKQKATMKLADKLDLDL